MSKRFAEEESAYRVNVQALRECDLLRSVHHADTFVVRYLDPVWRPLLGEEYEDESLFDLLGLAPTDRLVLQLYGKCVHRDPSWRFKVPRMTSFVPYADGDRVVMVRSIAKPDICKIIGKSESAVNESVQRMRGTKGKTSAMFDHRLVFAHFCPRGIALEIMTTPQQAFPFAYEEYMTLKRAAISARAATGEPSTRQAAWCDEAKKTIARREVMDTPHAEQVVMFGEVGQA